MLRVAKDPHIGCSLCQKIAHPVTLTFGEKESFQIVNRKRRITQLSNGEELLFPEDKYHPDGIPWYKFFCGHRYHVPCLARLNPNKYTDITYRGDHRGTLDMDEFHCIDCRGTQKINYMFNPEIEGGVNITDPNTGTIYINVPDAFEKAEKDMETFRDRDLEVIQVDLDLRYFINDESTRKEIEERILPEMKETVVKFLTLQKPDAQFPLVPVPLTKEFALVNRVTGKPLEMHTVSLADLMDGIDVHWTDADIEMLKTRQMDIKQLNVDHKTDTLHIARLNRIAGPIKRYLHGDKDARKSIQDDYMTKAMLYSEVRPSNRLCVKNHAGEERTLVTFDDFPIRLTNTCSIMGGTRRKTTKRFQTKLIRK